MSSNGQHSHLGMQVVFFLCYCVSLVCAISFLLLFAFLLSALADICTECHVSEIDQSLMIIKLVRRVAWVISKHALLGKLHIGNNSIV